MKPQLHADQGFKHREGLFIDTPLLHFIEDELLQDTDISSNEFFSALAVLVDELGAKYRKIVEQLKFGDIPTSVHLHTFSKRLHDFTMLDQTPEEVTFIRGNACGLLDEFNCRVPACIIDAMITTVIAERCNTCLHIATQDHEHAELLENLFEQADRLLGLRHEKVLIQTPAPAQKVA